MENKTSFCSPLRNIFKLREKKRSTNNNEKLLKSSELQISGKTKFTVSRDGKKKNL